MRGLLTVFLFFLCWNVFAMNNSFLCCSVQRQLKQKSNRSLSENRIKLKKKNVSSDNKKIFTIAIDGFQNVGKNTILNRLISKNTNRSLIPKNTNRSFNSKNTNRVMNIKDTEKKIDVAAVDIDDVKCLIWNIPLIKTSQNWSDDLIGNFDLLIYVFDACKMREGISDYKKLSSFLKYSKLKKTPCLLVGNKKKDASCFIYYPRNFLKTVVEDKNAKGRKMDLCIVSTETGKNFKGLLRKIYSILRYGDFNSLG